MKKSKNILTRRIFVGDNIQQMSNLLIFLTNNHFSVSLKKSKHLPYYNINEPYYEIVIPTSEHYDAFDLGVLYCIQNNYDDIICECPNLDWDSIKNIKERDLEMTK